MGAASWSGRAALHQMVWKPRYVIGIAEDGSQALHREISDALVLQLGENDLSDHKNLDIMLNIEEDITLLWL